MVREIEQVLKVEREHWVGTGFRVKQIFPRFTGLDFLKRISPFILLDYNDKVKFKGTKIGAGIGPHPHRGLETVTFCINGTVEHTDNKGNSGVITDGEMQWMTAGSGILHKEYHEKEYANKDRIFHAVQLWINLPKKYKMTNPKYQTVFKDDIQKYISDDKNLEVDVYAGNAFGKTGKISTFSPINIYSVKIKKGKKIELNEPENFNFTLLVCSGSLNINGEQINDSDYVLFKNEKGVVELEAIEDSQIYVMSGEPLNEEFVVKGTFVMNTEEEIKQAYEDFDNGKFGTDKF